MPWGGGEEAGVRALRAEQLTVQNHDSLSGDSPLISLAILAGRHLSSVSMVWEEDSSAFHIFV